MIRVKIDRFNVYIIFTIKAHQRVIKTYIIEWGRDNIVEIMIKS